MPGIHYLAKLLKPQKLPKNLISSCVHNQVADDPLSSKSLVDHLIRANYVIDSGDNAIFDKSCLTLHTLGNILLKNWEAEWKKYSVPDDEAFQNDINISSSKSNFDSVLLEKVRKYLPSSGNWITGVNFTDQSSDQYVGAFRIQRRLIIALSGQSSAKVDDKVRQIQFEQMRFIKNYFNKPGRVRFCKGDTNDSATEHHEILYESNGYNLVLQDMKKFSQQVDNLNKITLFSVDLQQIFMAVMLDAYGNRDDSAYLKLHPKLAPVKVIVLHECDNKDGNLNKMNQLVEEVCLMLRSVNITCWNGISKGLNVSCADELGTPFTIILTTTMLDNGIVFLRNLNTTIRMEVHISVLRKKLLKYLNSS